MTTIPIHTITVHSSVFFFLQYKFYLTEYTFQSIYEVLFFGKVSIRSLEMHGQKKNVILQLRADNINLMSITSQNFFCTSWKISKNSLQVFYGNGNVWDITLRSDRTVSIFQPTSTCFLSCQFSLLVEEDTV